MAKDFSVYLNAYTGSYTYATEPYSDIPSTNLKDINVYTDSGIGQLFDTPELTKLVGQMIYSDNKANVKLQDQSDVLAIVSQSSFFFPNGTINTIGSIYNGTNEQGYQIANTKQLYNIVGGVGEFYNVKGNVVFETFENNLIKYTFMFQ